MLRNHLKGFLAVFCVSLILLPLTACSREKPRQLSDVKPDLTTEIDYGLKYALNPREIKQYQPQLRMAATFKDGVLRLRVQNKSSRPMLVGPQHFAFIKGLQGSGKPLEVTPLQLKSILTKFPTTELGTNDIANGTFKFPEPMGDFTGEYIVFKHEDKKVLPSRCRVSPEPE